jgi:hypothetical protein
MAGRNRRIRKDDARTRVHTSGGNLYGELGRTYMCNREITIGITQITAGYTGVLRVKGRKKRRRRRRSRRQAGEEKKVIFNCTYRSI